MSDYDLIAPFYDIEHTPFDEDLDMYRNFAELCGGKILELACGSGRLLLPLASEGYVLTGVDTSAAMLELAQQGLAKAGINGCCQLVQQDMCSLQLEEKFSLAMIALGSFRTYYHACAATAGAGSHPQASQHRCALYPGHQQ